MIKFFPFRLKLDLRKFIFSLLILLAVLLILVEISRGVLTLDSRRVYGSVLSASLLYSALRLKGSVNRAFILLTIFSLIFPPILLLALLLPKEHLESVCESTQEEGEESIDLLNASYRSNLVICRSVRLMGSLATSLALEISKRRRVVLVDWNGEARSRLKEVDCKIANPSDVWFGYQGSLGISYYITLSEVLSYLTGADPSSILGLLMKENPPALSDPKMSDHEPIISAVRSGVLRIEDALPKLVGVLVIDASKLNAKGKNMVSLITLFQCSVYIERDFLVIAPLLNPLTDEKLNPRIRDELMWMISSLSKAGCFILSTRESSRFSDEFDSVLECDDCVKPVYKLDNFRLCAWIRDKGRKRA
ncbi:MAG: hypothetical protein NZ992_06410 [Candidatus Korarchaeum sp.]|nr:hypothetical protein [Candidatus Korarchaeum sp.]